MQDIGGGIRTILAQIAAEELGLDPHQVAVHIGDTNYPQGPPSGGSMTTASLTPAVRDAAFKARMRMARQLAPILNVAPEQVIFAKGNVNDLSFRSACARLNTDEIAARATRSGDYTTDPGTDTGGKSKSTRVFYGGAQFAQVAVDTETSKIWVEKVWAIHDCGRSMNSLYLQSQINGGILQGISYVFYGERIIDRNTGIMVNANLEKYNIIGSRESPEVHIHVPEDYLALSSTDAGGIGEPATIPTSGAIANAVFNATGARVTQLPMKPSVVLAALAAAQKGSPA